MKPRTPRFVMLALMISLVACTERQPPARTSVTEGTARDQEVLECREQADRSQPAMQSARGALIGVPVGAGLGAIIGGLLFANPNPAIWMGALAGGVGGAVLGGVEGAELERGFADCLNSRAGSPKTPS
jgi:hypothetical protein